MYLCQILYMGPQLVMNNQLSTIFLQLGVFMHNKSHSEFQLYNCINDSNYAYIYIYIYVCIYTM